MGRVHKKIRFIRQETVYVDTDKRHEVMDKYRDNGFHCVSCGPKPIKCGIFSMTRHKLIFIKKAKHLKELRRTFRSNEQGRIIKKQAEEIKHLETAEADANLMADLSKKYEKKIQQQAERIKQLEAHISGNPTAVVQFPKGE